MALWERFWNVYQSCSYRKPSALLVGEQGAVNGLSQFICASVVLQKQLYLINLQQSGALRECITFVFELTGDFVVYSLNIESKKKLKYFMHTHFCKLKTKFPFCSERIQHISGHCVYALQSSWVQILLHHGHKIHLLLEGLIRE